MVADKIIDTSAGGIRVFNSDFTIKGMEYVRAFVDVLGDNVWTTLSQSGYTIINDNVVFKEAPVGAFVSIQVATTPEELASSPTENAIVASIRDDILVVSGLQTEILSLIADKLKLDSLYADKVTLDSLYADKATLDSLFADKATLDSLYADKATLDSLFADKLKLDSLYADKATLDSLFADKATLDSLFADKATLDSLFADKATLDSLFADKGTLDSLFADKIVLDGVYQRLTEINNFFELYHGALAVEPNITSHPSLSVGDLYFDTVLDVLRVFKGTSWVSVSSTVSGIDRSEEFTAGTASNLYDGVSLVSYPLLDGYDAGFANVYHNGSLLKNANIDISSGVTVDLVGILPIAGDIISVVAFGVFELADVYTKSESDILHRSVPLKVKAGEAIGIGQVVKATSYTAGLDSINVSLTVAQADVAIGVARESLANGVTGDIVTRGVVEGLDTSAWAFGDILYSAGAGGLTNVKPAGAYQAVGYVVKDSVGAGAIMVDFTEPNLSQLKADIDSPTFTGTPTAPTPTAGDSSTKLATTEFVLDTMSVANYTLGTGQDFADLNACLTYFVTNGNRPANKVIVTVPVSYEDNSTFLYQGEEGEDFDWLQIVGASSAVILSIPVGGLNGNLFYFANIHSAPTFNVNIYDNATAGSGAYTVLYYVNVRRVRVGGGMTACRTTNRKMFTFSSCADVVLTLPSQFYLSGNLGNAQYGAITCIRSEVVLLNGTSMQNSSAMGNGIYPFIVAQYSRIKSGNYINCTNGHPTYRPFAVVYGQHSQIDLYGIETDGGDAKYMLYLAGGCHVNLGACWNLGVVDTDIVFVGRNFCTVNGVDTTITVAGITKNTISATAGLLLCP